MMNREYMAACECSHLVAVYFHRDAAHVCTEQVRESIQTIVYSKLELNSVYDA